MNRARYAIAVVVFLTVCFTSDLSSASTQSTSDFEGLFPGVDVRVTGQQIVARDLDVRLVGETQGAVSGFVRAHAQFFGLDASLSSLELLRTTAVGSGAQLVFEQLIDGRPVFGAQVLAFVGDSGRLERISSNLLPAPARGLDPSLTEALAIRSAHKGIDFEGFPARIDLGYLPVQGHARLAYRVVTPTKGPHLWISFVDAQSGVVVLRQDAVRSVSHSARIYRESDSVDAELMDVELDNIISEGEHAFHTYGQYVRTASCSEMDMSSMSVACRSWEFQAEATEEAGFAGIHPILDGNPLKGDGFAELMVYYTLDKQSRWFRDEFGVDVQFGDPEAFADVGEATMGDHIWVYVNLDFDNGFFSGGGYYGLPDLIMLGSIFGRDLAYDNDVVLHEYAHAMSSKLFGLGMGSLDNLGLDMSAMGIEEGNADYFAMTTNGNAMLGEYVGVGRNGDNDNSCPADIMGEGHHDGMIVSGALWDIREALGKKKADHLQFNTLLNNQINNFSTYGIGLIAEAKALESSDDDDLRFSAEDVAIVEGVVEARNLIDCIRAVPIDPDDTEPLLHYSPYPITEKGSPSSVQYLVRSKSDTETLSFNITPMGDVDYDVLVREGEPVEFDWIGDYPMIDWEANYDMSVLAGDEMVGPNEVRVSNITKLELKKDTDYYFSIICRPAMSMGMGSGCKNLIGVSLSDEQEEAPVVETPDEGSAEDDLPDEEIDTSGYGEQLDEDSIVENSSASKKSGCSVVDVASANKPSSVFSFLNALL